MHQAPATINPPAIHQFAAGFTSGDAISGVCLQLQKIFQRWGVDSSIYADPPCILPECREFVSPANDAIRSLDRNDIALLHLSIGSPVNLIFRQLPCRKIILYHNITPPNYFRLINPQTAACLDRGKEQVKALADCADINLAVSKFNALELESYGYQDVKVFPLPFDFEALTRVPDALALRYARSPLTTILFVGRCVPNKKIESLLTLFDYYQKTINRNSRLIIAGAWQGAERYFAMLNAQVRERKLEHVVFTGKMSQSLLAATYRSADIYISMSEHEGFCMPLIEAMTYSLPVMALSAGAVPETLDHAGVLITRIDYPVVAEMLHRIVTDATLRDKIIRKQADRLNRYRQRDPDAELRMLISPYMESLAI